MAPLTPCSHQVASISLASMRVGCRLLPFHPTLHTTEILTPCNNVEGFCHSQMLDGVPPGQCADLLAAVLTPAPPVRLAVLDAVDVGARLRLALQLVKVHGFLMGESPYISELRLSI